MSRPKDEETRTEVLDFEILNKKKMEQVQTPDLEFNIPQEIQSAPIEIKEKEEALVIFFDYQESFFKNLKDQFKDRPSYLILQSLEELNGALKKAGNKIIVFNYDNHPKIVNQLIAQIKSKFKNAKTMIMAQSLSPEKVKKHASTEFGANCYFQLPFEKTKFEEEINSLNKF
ncbi:MAG: hypothetical protein AB7I27_17450 [Bacteriovoracaceae bacterium]